MINNFTQAREAEMNYHENFYNETSLFQAGTWLSKPVQVVMDLLEQLNLNQVSVLDLGCGVGRNSIPIAQKVKSHGGSVLGVDLLPTAIDKLSKYIEEYDIQRTLDTEVADAEYYEIEREEHDYIIACSCLEHVSNIEAFKKVILRMIEGTKKEGINCILMSTEVKEYDLEQGKEKDGLVELNVKTDVAISILREQYKEWEILIERCSPQTVREKKQGKDIEFRSQWLTFAARRRSGII
ncbi:class I SAM-dependent methyltransferase [Saccharibacillus sp. CPCC 101409]|uniref:class I SAM-dependent methyltransferase n=1 Tax=Saccharibacillus sp. CPCC 101409 TaxID=3058041 RepID=UPI0026726A29|nr:class I SAM-dependent methyltransferase [Saccharibacillus sp. CPCC 101409]MDO3413409.1 class I SAM-dependent methyltransferase [Saccharibacillus sp. CPCC 101409]